MSSYQKPGQVPSAHAPEIGEFPVWCQAPSSSMRTILISPSPLEDGSDGVKGAAQLHVFDSLDPIDI